MSDNLSANGESKSKTMHGLIIGKKQILIFVAVILAVIVILCTLFSKGSGEVTLFYSSANKGAVVYCDNKLAKDIISGKSASAVKFSEDNINAAVLMSQGSSYSIYYTDGSKVKCVSENTSSNYTISYNGKTVAYCDTLGVFFIYDKKSGSTKKIAEHVTSFVLSPDGKSIIYSQAGDLGETLMLYSNKKSKALGNNYTPLGLSDSCDMIYVLSSDNSIYILDESGAVVSKLISSAQPDFIRFSENMEQILFCDEQHTYISVLGKSRIRLIPGRAEPIDSCGCAVFADTTGKYRIICSETLLNMYYFADNNGTTQSLFFIKKDGTRLDIAESVLAYEPHENGSLTYLTDNGSIYTFKKDKAEAIISGVTKFATDKNGRRIFYIKDSSLYMRKSDKDKIVAQGVSEVNSAANGDIYFILNDGM